MEKAGTVPWGDVRLRFHPAVRLVLHGLPDRPGPVWDGAELRAVLPGGQPEVHRAGQLRAHVPGRGVLEFPAGDRYLCAAGDPVVVGGVGGDGAAVQPHPAWHEPLPLTVLPAGGDLTGRSEDHTSE